MDSITVQKNGLTERVNKIEQTLKTNPDAEYLPALITGLSNSYDALSLDFHATTSQNPEERKNHRQDLYQLRTRIHALQNEFALTRPKVMGTLDVRAPSTQQELIEHARDVTNSSIKSLDHTAQVIQATKTIGAATVVKIDSQTGQMARIQETLFTIDDQIQIARNSIGRLVRSVASNKILWIFIGLIFASLIFILIWKSKHK